MLTHGAAQVGEQIFGQEACAISACNGNVGVGRCDAPVGLEQRYTAKASRGRTSDQYIAVLNPRLVVHLVGNPGRKRQFGRAVEAHLDVLRLSKEVVGIPLLTLPTARQERGHYLKRFS